MSDAEWLSVNASVMGVCSGKILEIIEEVEGSKKPIAASLGSLRTVADILGMAAEKENKRERPTIDQVRAVLPATGEFRTRDIVEQLPHIDQVRVGTALNTLGRRDRLIRRVRTEGRAIVWAIRKTGDE